MHTLAIAFQPDWWTVLQAGFMRTALLGGSIVALAASLVGYFVVIRDDTFAAHALAHIGFPGATAAVLIGAPVTLGLIVFCVAAAVVMGLTGERASRRDTTTGTILAFATGLGILFASLATQSTTTVTSILFGNLLAITPGQLALFATLMLAMAVALALTFRPLLLASVNPQVAQARGIPTRPLALLFLVLLALVVAMAVQVVGTLLLFGLIVTPAATALMLTARPSRVIALSAAIGLASVWLGLALSAMFNLPPSFLIIAIATLTWATAALATRDRRPGTDPSSATPAHTDQSAPAVA
jgi:zinc/manganese transport system permease protein